MSIRMNVGWQRKLSQDFNSCGASSSIDFEVAADPKRDPDGFADEVRAQFALARAAVEAELAAHGETGRRTVVEALRDSRPASNGHALPAPARVEQPRAPRTEHKLPANGNAMYAWARDNGVDAMIKQFAKDQGWRERIVEFGPVQRKAAFDAACEALEQQESH